MNVMSVIVQIVAVIGSILVFVGFIELVMKLRKRKTKAGETPYVVKFLRKEGDRYVVVGKEKFHREDKFVKFKNKRYPVSLKDFTYAEKNEILVFYDYDTNKQLSFQDFKNDLCIDDIDQIMTNKVIERLMARISEGIAKRDYVLIIVLGVAFLCIGFFAGWQYALKTFAR
jgi:hypothetical protein